MCWKISQSMAMKHSRSVPEPQDDEIECDASGRTAELWRTNKPATAQRLGRGVPQSDVFISIGLVTRTCAGFRTVRPRRGDQSEAARKGMSRAASDLLQGPAMASRLRLTLVLSSVVLMGCGGAPADVRAKVALFQRKMFARR